MGKLKGKVAIITGGGQGVGLGIAQAFADQGASLVLTGRSRDKLERVVPDLEARGGKVAVNAADVRSREDAFATVKLAVDTFGGLDVLVNNAQISHQGVALEDNTVEVLDESVQSGLYGSIWHMQAALPHFKARGAGSVINMASYQGTHGAAYFTAYAATKEAIRGLTRAAAREWGPYGIRINNINPSAITEAAERWLEDFPEQAAENLKTVALGRWGNAYEDIGPVAVFLASEDSAYMTGQTLAVEGGMMML
ncbi:SDR family NAD(P)-dependent oxidoreductase [Novosphingobium malaysiense]|uniref:Short-chain dehydrogenase n=1 Tax=Novosphingobium malaysiense TaxID=1348853 RepID=A0A0B1ZIT8_9SPHN|nr:SDR family oxidoreductase [Novosphingobium malaysiense]KHK89183.1 short-chain dehydrogenase [Novosphingobium malaysiense]